MSSRNKQGSESETTKREIVESSTNDDVDESNICNDDELHDVENRDGEEISINCKEFGKDNAGLIS